MKEKAAIDKVYTRPYKATMPTLLKFQNGELATISKENTQFCRVLRKRVKGAGAKVAMVVSNDQIYHGAIDAGEAQALTDNYICVRNKITNKVRIIPIEQATLNNHIYATLEQKRLTALTAEKTKLLLMKEFGGRKASRYVANQANMKVNIDVLKDDLDNTLQDTTLIVSTKDDKADTETNFDLLRPIFNKAAKNLHEVYNVEDVVPAELLERLEEEAKVVYATSIDKLPIQSEYLCQCIRNIQKAPPANAGFLHLKLIIYMDSLSKLIKARANTLKKLELSGITEKVENDVRTRFSDPNMKSFTRSLYSTEKALCYFLVLALLISENYTVNVNVLSQELCLSKKKLLKFAHIVQARTHSNSDNLTLRLPSTMTPLSTGFSRRSKK